MKWRGKFRQGSVFHSFGAIIHCITSLNLTCFDKLNNYEEVNIKVKQITEWN